MSRASSDFLNMVHPGRILIVLIMSSLFSSQQVFCLSGAVGISNDELAIKNRSDQVVRGCNSFEDKVRALRQYVHDKMKLPPSGKKPNGTTLMPEDIYPLNTIERLDSRLGGWCDQQAQVFMRLAQKQGITTRMVWLYRKNHKDNNDSCHTIAEAYDGHRWVIVDPMFNLELQSKDGKMASRDDVMNDPDIMRRILNIQELEKDNRWNDEEWLSIYTLRNYSYIPFSYE